MEFETMSDIRDLQRIQKLEEAIERGEYLEDIDLEDGF